MKGVIRAGGLSNSPTPVSFDDLNTKLERVFGSGSQSKAVLDFVTRELRRSVRHYSWVGIYAVEGDSLVLRSWSGPASTQHARIPIGEGICGLAAHRSETVVVPDVSKDPRYLECFPSTKAEIVVPIRADSKVIGEIDVDSDDLDPFSDDDRSFLEGLAPELARFL